MAIQTWSFEYTGSVQNIELIPGIYIFEVWGAQGGAGFNTTGGYGGYSIGTIKILGGVQANIFVGGAGKTISGGFNGGGTGGRDTNSQHGGGGGGASDIRIGSTSLNDRVIVAGGGAGGGRDGNTGYGGGLVGGVSSNYNTGYTGEAGTQKYGGEPFTYSRGATAGGFGYGGNGSTNYYSAGGGGGGGGWYGGGGGTSTANHGSGYSGGGGGGSGYLSPRLTDAYTSPAVKDGHGKIKISLISTLLFYSFSILQDGKYYIPSKEFFNKDTMQFSPVPLSYLTNGDNLRHFIFDKKLLNRRIYFNDFDFLPLEKFSQTNLKIVKMQLLTLTESQILLVDDSITSTVDNANAEPNKIIFKYNTDISNFSNSVIRVENLNKPLNQQFDFINLGYNPNIKVLINSDGKFYGENLKETTLDKILTDGIDGNKLPSYNLTNFFNFDVYIIFKNRCYIDSEKLLNLSFNSKNFTNMKKVLDKDYYIYHDTKNDLIYMKLNKDYSNIVLNKISSGDLDFNENLETF